MCRASITNTSLADAVGCLPEPQDPQIHQQLQEEVDISHFKDLGLSSSFSKTFAKFKSLRVMFLGATSTE